MNAEDFVKSMHKSLGDKIWFQQVLGPKAIYYADLGCADGAVLQRVAHIGVGYDHREDMIALAPHTSRLTFTTNWSRFKAHIDQAKRDGLKVCLILSSVMHELIGQRGFKDTWADIRSLDCDYIAVRDMAVEQHGPHVEDLERRLKEHYNRPEEWEENYFPLTLDQWVNYTTIGSGYKIKHLEHYTPQHLKDAYGVGFETHIKLLLKRT